MQANILQVVQEYVPLKRAGTSYKGLLPVPQREDAVVSASIRTRASSTASAAASAATCSSSSSCTRRSASRTRCGCSRRNSAWRCPNRPKATADDARRDSALRGGAAEGARDCGGLFHGAAWRRRPAPRARRSSAERDVTPADDRRSSASVSPPIRATASKAAPAETRVRPGRTTAERADRAARERRSSGSVP